MLLHWYCTIFNFKPWVPHKIYFSYHLHSPSLCFWWETYLFEIRVQFSCIVIVLLYSAAYRIKHLFPEAHFSNTKSSSIEFISSYYDQHHISTNDKVLYACLSGRVLELLLSTCLAWWNKSLAETFFQTFPLFFLCLTGSTIFISLTTEAREWEHNVGCLCMYGISVLSRGNGSAKHLSSLRA